MAAVAGGVAPPLSFSHISDGITWCSIDLGGPARFFSGNNATEFGCQQAAGKLMLA